MGRVRVSDIIKRKDIESWKQGDIITIEAGTGVGKSYFIKNGLYSYAKERGEKILFLIHRSNCRDQFQHEIEKDGKADIINIATYQSMESLYEDRIDITKYTYIVCDEFHYFMSDALFNSTTDISLNKILNQSNKIRIFMSATGGEMVEYIKDTRGFTTKDYALPIDFDFVNSLTFYNTEKHVDMLIEQFKESGGKSMFFVHSVSKAYDMYREYKDVSMFNCSKHNQQFYKYVNKHKMDNLLHTEQFTDDILFTTTAMDAGVNIIDESVKNIVVDIKDIGVLIQCIGRKRMQHNKDKINLYVRDINNNEIGGLITQANKKLEMVNYFNEHGTVEYVKRYGRENDYSKIVHDDIDENGKLIKTRNDLTFFKIKNDIKLLNEIIGYGSGGYKQYISNLLGFNNTTKGGYSLMEREIKKERLEDYLDSIVGLKIDTKEQKNELINMIDVRVDRKQQRSYTKLNDGLEMLGLDYIILPKRTMHGRYWVVDNISR